MPSIRRNPLDDPLVRTWDAVVTGNGSSRQIDQAAVAVLDRLHAAFDGPEADSAFLNRLESELFSVQAQNGASTANDASSSSFRNIPLPLTRRELESERAPKLIRLVIDNLAIAAILAIILGGLAVTFVSERSEPESASHIPAIIDSREELERQLNPPQLEALLDITIDSAALGGPSPTAWEQLDFSLTHLEPGAEFSTVHPYYSCCPSLIVLQIMQGSAEFTAEGPASIYRMGSRDAEAIASGEFYELEIGDAVVFSTASQATVRNADTEELQMLNGRAIEFGETRTFGLKPEGFTDSPYLWCKSMKPMQTEVVDFRFERVLLYPDAQVTVESRSDERLIGWYPEMLAIPARFVNGDESAMSPDNPGLQLGSQYTIHNYSAGQYTIFNVDDEPITLHFLHVIESPDQPASSAATPAADSTPAAAMATIETLLDLSIAPADLAAADPATWDTLRYEEVHVQAGEGFTTEAPYFAGMDDGIAVYYVQQGKLSLTVDGPLDVYRSGSGSPERPAPGTTVELLPSDKAAFSQESIATLDNPGPDELVMLGGYAFHYTEMSGSRTNPEGYETPYYVFGTSMIPLDADVVGVSFERMTLPPEATHPFEIDSNDRVARFANEFNIAPRWVVGNYESIPEGELGMIFSKFAFDFPPGPYTIFNPHDQPLTIYLIRLEDADAAASSTPAATPDAAPEATPVAALQPQPIDSLLNIQVSPADLDAQTSDNWDVMEFSLVTVNAGESFTTDHPWFTCCDGMAVFQVRAGSASFVVDGPADLFAAGSGQTPVRIPAATLFALESGQTAVFAMESPAIVTNTGSDDLVMLAGYGYQFMGPVTYIRPDGYHNRPLVIDSNMDPIPAESLEVSFEQVSLEPGELTHIESRELERLVGWFPETNTTVRMALGELDAIPTEPFGSSMVQSFVMYNFSSGPYTFFNTGKNPATLTMMRIAPAANLVTATPVASPAASEAPTDIILNAVVNTSVHGFGADPGWDQASFTEATLEPQSSVSSTDPDFGCCQGLHFITVLDGELTVQMNRPISSSVRGNEVPVSGNPITLGAGETAIYEGEMIATNTGETETRFLHGGVYNTAIPASPAVPPQGYQSARRVMTSYTHDPALVLQSIDIHRAIIEPGQALPLSVTPNDTFLLLSDGNGALAVNPAGTGEPAPAGDGAGGVGALTSDGLEAGDYDVLNTGSTPVTVYILWIGPDRAPPQV